MVHQGVVGSHFMMAVGDVLVDECHRLLPAMKLDAAIQVTGKLGKSFYPSVEARFKFGSRWYRHLYSGMVLSGLLGSHRLPGREYGMACQGMEPGCVRPFSPAKAGCLFREEYV